MKAYVLGMDSFRESHNYIQLRLTFVPFDAADGS